MIRSHATPSQVRRQRIRFKTTFLGFFCMLILFPQTALAAEPITVGGGDAAQVCDSAHTEMLPQNQMVKPEELEDAESSEANDISPDYKTCLTVTGACKVKTKTSATTAYLKTGWAVSAFFDAGIGAVRSSTVTTITCEGTYLFTVSYSGGLTIYQGQSTVLTAQSIDGEDVSEDGPTSQSCTYIAALTGCSTTHRREWSGELVMTGNAPAELPVCIKVKIVVDENLLKLPYLGTSGYGSQCFDAMKLVVDGDAALLSVQELLGSSS